MENLTGFIVEVSTKQPTPIAYQYDEKPKVLQPHEIFVGYFWQMTDKQQDGSFMKAHVNETILKDAEKKLFSYAGEAVFSISDVVITIHALRGPDSNNRHLPKKLQKYETLYRATSE